MELSENQRWTLNELLKKYNSEMNGYVKKNQEEAIKESVRYFITYTFIDFDSDVLQEFLKVVKNDQ